MDDYIPRVRYYQEDLELMLKSCYSSPVLTSVEIFGEIKPPRDLILASILRSKPCPCPMLVVFYFYASESPMDNEQVLFETLTIQKPYL